MISKDDLVLSVRKEQSEKIERDLKEAIIEHNEHSVKYDTDSAIGKAIANHYWDLTDFGKMMTKIGYNVEVDTDQAFDCYVTISI